MTVGRAFGAPFRDPKWFQKVALAVLISFVPIVSFAVGGWGIAYLRNCAQGRDEQLPDWNEFGTYWVSGIAFWFASILYYIPTILIVVVIGIPGLLGGALQASGGSVEDALAGLGGAIASVGLGLFLALLFTLAVSYLVQAARTHYAVRGEFGAAFDFKGIFAAVKANPGGYFVAWLMQIVAIWGGALLGAAIGVALSWVPCATLITVPLSMAVGVTLGMGVNALFGQYAALAYGLSGAQPGWPSPAPQAYPPAPGSFGSVPPSPAGYPNASPYGGHAAVAAVVANTAQRNLETPGAGLPRLATLPPGAAAYAPTVIPTQPRTDDAGASSTGASDVTASFEPVAVADTQVRPEGAFTRSAPEQPLAVEVPPTETPQGSAPVDTPVVGAVAPAQDAAASALVIDTAPPSEPSVDDAPSIDSVSGFAQEPAAPEVTAESEPEAPVQPQVEPQLEPESPPEPVAIAPQTAPAEEHAAPAAPVDAPAVTSVSVGRVLKKLSGPGRPSESWVLPRTGRVTIGRATSCYVSLSDDGRVSRKHAVLAVDADGCTVTDLGSSNGSRLNGTPLGEEAVRLSSGDELECGGTAMRIEFTED